MSKADQAIKILLKTGSRLESGLFKVWFKKQLSESNRFFYSVSKTVSKSSVTRNKLKRRVREWARKNCNPDCKKNLAVLFVFKPEASRVTKKEFYEELGEIFNKVLSKNNFSRSRNS